MTENINAVLLYLAGKNYHSHSAEINKAVNIPEGLESVMSEIETLGLVHTKTNEYNKKGYLLKQYVKDGLHNLPDEFAQNPYAYFKELHLEKQRIIAENKISTRTLINEKKYDGLKKKNWSWKKGIKMILSIIATTLTLLKLKRKN